MRRRVSIRNVSFWTILRMTMTLNCTIMASRVGPSNRSSPTTIEKTEVRCKPILTTADAQRQRLERFRKRIVVAARSTWQTRGRATISRIGTSSSSRPLTIRLKRLGSTLESLSKCRAIPRRPVSPQYPRKKPPSSSRKSAHAITCKSTTADAS